MQHPYILRFHFTGHKINCPKSNSVCRRPPLFDESNNHFSHNTNFLTCTTYFIRLVLVAKCDIFLRLQTRRNCSPKAIYLFTSEAHLSHVYLLSLSGVNCRLTTQRTITNRSRLFYATLVLVRCRILHPSLLIKVNKECNHQISLALHVYALLKFLVVQYM